MMNGYDSTEVMMRLDCPYYEMRPGSNCVGLAFNISHIAKQCLCGLKRESAGLNADLAAKNTYSMKSSLFKFKLVKRTNQCLGVRKIV